jgi:hypothetical protein
MQYDVETAQAYLRALADDWRREMVEGLRKRNFLFPLALSG